MDTWSFSELDSCRKLLYSALDKTGYLQRLDRWGAIPRFVFEKIDKSDQAQLDQAIAKCDAARVSKSLGGALADNSVSHRVLHIRVAANYVDAHMTWASMYVATRVAYKLWTEEEQQLRLFLSATASKGEYGGLRGVLWEGFCHARLAAGGRFASRALSDGSLLYVDLPRDSHEVVFDKWSDVTTISSDAYLRPRVWNKASIDSARQPGYLYQITVARDHRINCAGLWDAVENMHNKSSDVYFILPPDRFASFQEQHIAQGKNVAELRTLIKQFAVEMSFDA